MLSGRRFAPARLTVVLVLAIVAGACATGGTFSKGEKAAENDDWDTAVAYFTKAVQQSPDKAEYKLALQRALEQAAITHLDKGRIAEAKEQLEEALREYRRAAEFAPLNGELAANVTRLQRKISERIEASRPKPRIEQLREQARQMSPEPTLNPASRQPLDIRFNNAPIRAILDFIAQSTGINVTYDRDTATQVDRQYSEELHGVTLEQALNQIMTANQLFYKVMDPHTIIVVSDTPQKRQAYEEQVIQTFYVSHADATELSAVLNQIIRVPGSSNQPTMQVNKSANTIVVRASAAVARIFEQVIEANDKPRAELIIDVEILEVNRTRAMQYGLDLNDYSANLVFSPEVVPGTGSTIGSTGGTPSQGNVGANATVSTATGVTHSNLFNLNSLSGVNRGDFYLSVPAAVIRLMETDADTRLVAKPQLRGSEGEKLTLNLGSQIPVPNTTFGAAGAGGINTIPISSFNLKDVGLNFAIQPRVTFDNDIILTIELENSTFLGNINTAGQNLPSFGSRKVSTRLRLRDGETNLLAGLIQSNDSKTVTGFPGLVRLPFFKQIFSSNNNQLTQNDIVMLLTPHIIRSHELTQQDVAPTYIGTANNLGLTGPPPLIQAPPPAPQPPAGGEQPPAAPGLPGGVAAPGAAGTPPTTTPTPTAGLPTSPTPVIPPGASPIPGTIATPPAGAAGTPPTAPAQPPAGAPMTPTPPTAAAPPAGAQPGTPATATTGAAPPTPGGALVAVSLSTTDFRVGGGPYNVPIMITGASGVAAMSVTIRYNPAVLRVRSVQDGSFMRQGGLSSGFAQQVDSASGRVDITFNRPGDLTGASGGGTLAAILFDPVAPGSTTLAISGVASGPGGAAIPIQFAPVTLMVR